MPARKKTLNDRIDEYTQQVLPSGCIIWTGYADKDGYAIACVSDGNVKKNRKVHRLVYEQAYGEIPEGMLVCHRCDVRSCVNPDHLFLGTHMQNVRDMWSKNRWKAGAQDNRGDRNPNSKLSIGEVMKITEMRRSGVKVRKLSQDFGVTEGQIYRICSGTAWSSR